VDGWSWIMKKSDKELRFIKGLYCDSRSKTNCYTCSF